MKKVFVSIAAVTIVVVAAMNVNVSLTKEKMFDVSLANVLALASGECSASGTSLSNLMDYRMTLTNTSKACGIAIKNNTSASVNMSSYGLDVEQKVVSGRVNVAMRAHAVAPDPLSTGRSIGVQAIAGNAMQGNNYGVFAALQGCSNGAALFATTDMDANSIVNNQYAGYFKGPVHVAGNLSVGAPNPSFTLHVSGNIGLNGSLLQTSDSRRKTNVEDLVSAVDKVVKLRPVTYNFKPEDLSKYYALVPDTVKIRNENHLRRYFGLGKKIDEKKKHIGFIAQELKEVFPDLVYEDKEGMLSVDYVSLIPVLVGALQEQNETIQQLNEAFQQLSKRLEMLENANGNVDIENNANSRENIFSFSLFPNPANSGFVTVNYTMFVDASICIELYSATMGQKMKVLQPKQNRKAGSYSVQTSIADMNTGAYIIRVTSENQIESKQLVISN